MRLIDADAIKYTMLYKENWMTGTGVEAQAVWKAEIDKMPSVEAEPKWIPITERLPKFYEHVLVSMKKEEGFEPISVGCFYKNTYNDDIMFDDFLGTCCRLVSTDILAWMPLPKPYERKEE